MYLYLHILYTCIHIYITDHRNAYIDTHTIYWVKGALQLLSNHSK